MDGEKSFDKRNHEQYYYKEIGFTSWHVSSQKTNSNKRAEGMMMVTFADPPNFHPLVLDSVTLSPVLC